MNWSGGKPNWNWSWCGNGPKIQRLRVNNDAAAATAGAAAGRERSLKREGKRQATPFARRKRVEVRKKPGRKAGQGRMLGGEPNQSEWTGRRRPACTAARNAGDSLKDIHRHEQYVTDIPPVRPITTRYITESGYCAELPPAGEIASSGANLGSHRSRRSTGGTASQSAGGRPETPLGVRMAKVSETFNDAFGLKVVAAAGARQIHAWPRRPAQSIRTCSKTIRRSSVVHVDETGWRIDTLSSWLWVFTNPEATVYTIADNRSSRCGGGNVGREVPRHPGFGWLSSL